MSTDDEIDRLVAAYVDGTLSGDEVAAFERLVQEHPEVMVRAAEAIRFDMQLSDAVRPDQLELVQQQRMIIDRASGSPVMVESTRRVGRVGAVVEPPSAPVSKPRFPWIAWPVALALAAVGIWLALGAGKDSSGPAPASPVWTPLPLKNAGFELPDLGNEPASSNVLQDWQDKFTTPNATLEALPPGEAHAGKQVATLAPGGHIKQLLFDKEGQPVIFAPGAKVRLSGWVKPVGTLSGRADVMHTALHFVDEKNRQYVVVYRIEPIDGSGWRRFSLDLTVPDQETFEPSYQYVSGEVTSVHGRQILLSITNISAQMPVKVGFMLDDMEVEFLPAQGSAGER